MCALAFRKTHSPRIPNWGCWWDAVPWELIDNFNERQKNSSKFYDKRSFLETHSPTVPVYLVRKDGRKEGCRGNWTKISTLLKKNETKWTGNSITSGEAAPVCMLCMPFFLQIYDRGNCWLTPSKSIVTWFSIFYWHDWEVVLNCQAMMNYISISNIVL